MAGHAEAIVLLESMQDGVIYSNILLKLYLKSLKNGGKLQLDENGERIKLPSGRWKSHKEDTVDWNDQKYCKSWRHEGEVIQNRYL